MVRNLVVGFFILSYASLAASQGPPFANSSRQQAYLDQQVSLLQGQLALTASQTVQVKAAMEAVFHGTATKTVAQVLHEICTPAQFIAWRETELASERASAANMAAAETDQVEKTTFLSTEQRNRVKAAFYQIELPIEPFA